MEKSQKELILLALQKGRMISKLEILQEIGCFNSGARISELRQEGFDIQHIMVKQNDKQFAKYFLIADGIRRKF